MRSARPLAQIVAALALVVGTIVGQVAPVSAAGPYKEETLEQVGNTTFLRFITLQDTTKSPAGVNDFSCVPSAAHPDPVVLIHGTGGNRYTNWGFLGPHLANAGYCVFALNYGGITPTFVLQATDVVTPEIPGVRPSGLDAGAAQIVQFIDQVRAATGAAQVDLVSHSQGGLLSLYVPKLVPGAAAKIRRVVTLGSVTNGTTANGFTQAVDAFGLGAVRPSLLRTLALAGCEVCGDFPIPGALVFEKLHAGGVAIPGIAYTMIASRDDHVVTPPESTFIDITQQVPAAQGEITNVFAQDVCPASKVGHIGLVYDKNVSQMIRNALDPANATPVVCGPWGPQY